MKRFSLLLSTVTLALSANISADDKIGDKKEDILSYSIGYQIGSNLSKQEFDVNQDVLFQGVKDAFANKPSAIDPEKAQATMQSYQQELQSKRIEAFQTMAKQNLEKSQSFLDENKSKEGVVTLDSGLQYKIVRAGEGKTPSIEDKVTTNYRGTLIDGTQFDSSYDRGEPATFPVNGVISGWTEALQLMKEGAHWQLYIPPQLAYGERGAGSSIPPNSALIFDIELLTVNQ